MLEISSYLYEKGLVPGKSGNISTKISYKNRNNILITPSGVSLKHINLKNVIMTGFIEFKY